MKLSVICVLACSAVAELNAQTSEPPRRAHHAVAYDEDKQRVIMTGGSTPLDGGNRFEMFNDLWEFDGVRWSPQQASGDKLSGVALAYDTRRKKILSFGGFDGNPRGDVRELDDGTWRSLPGHPSIVAAEPGFVYDSARDRFVAFGGSASRGHAHGDTWEFDGAAWVKVDSSGPPARQGLAMVYDARRGRTVVFGGMGTAPEGQRPPTLGDTWEFDGKTWTQFQVTGPSPRMGAGAAYDSRRGRVVLFGGMGASGFSGETWSWDGAEWKKLSDTGPEPRGMGYVTYDKARDRVVMFGGRKGWPNGDLSDTWEFDGSSWKKIEAQ